MLLYLPINPAGCPGGRAGRTTGRNAGGRELNPQPSVSQGTILVGRRSAVELPPARAAGERAGSGYAGEFLSPAVRRRLCRALDFSRLLYPGSNTQRQRFRKCLFLHPSASLFEKRLHLSVELLSRLLSNPSVWLPATEARAGFEPAKPGI